VTAQKAATVRGERFKVGRQLIFGNLESLGTPTDGWNGGCRTCSAVLDRASAQVNKPTSAVDN
jgi:hypothetical protein